MTKDQRVAMARIISNMIKADNLIEENEIVDMKKLMLKYSITQQDMSDARNVRFSEAVMILKDISAKDRQSFFDSIAIPLPPLEEQKRIVAKIEELFNELK